MFSSPKKQPQNHYKKYIIDIAQMSNYQSIPSISKQSNDFNYTIIKKSNQIAKKVTNIDHNRQERVSKRYESVASKNSQDDTEKWIKISYKGYNQQSGLVDRIQRQQKEQKGVMSPKLRNGRILRSSRNYQSASNKKMESQQSFQQDQEKFHDKFLTIDTGLELDSRQRDQSQLDDNGILRPKMQVKAIKIRGSLKDQEKFYYDHKDLLSRQRQKNITIKNDTLNSQGKLEDVYANYHSNLHYQNNVIEDCSDQQDEEQFEKDAKPGPGYYQVNYSTFSTKATNKSFNFGGKAQRFKELLKQESNKKSVSNSIRQKVKQQRFSQMSNPEKIKKKVKVPFGSNISKQMKMNKDAYSNPGPVDYRPRQGIEEELIKKIQRSFKGNFGVCQKRFSTLRKWDQMGPGKYNLMDSLDNEVANNGSYFFLSKNNRFQDNLSYQKIK